MEKSRLNIFITVFAVATIVSGSLLFYVTQQSNKVTVEQLRNDAIFVYDAPIALETFSLETHDGRAFNNDALVGHWSLVFFGYTFCPDICPITMAAVKQFYDLLEDVDKEVPLEVIMVSVDPERDTREVLGNYVQYFNPEFTGARGDFADVYQLARNVNLTFSYIRVDEDNYLVNHNGEVMVMDPNGDNVGFLKAPYKPQLMLENFLALKSYWESGR